MGEESHTTHEELWEQYMEVERRELEQRKKDVADADAARDKARTTNKPAFRP